MKVLFVAQYAPHREKKIPVHVQAQMDSLLSNNIDVVPYPFYQRGFVEKIKSFLRLRKYLKSNSYDIVHCHFSYIGLAGLFSSPINNVVVSFMGTDLEMLINRKKHAFLNPTNLLTKILIKNSHLLKGVLVKNEKHYNYISNIVKCPLINLPNGVNLNKFHPINQELARRKIKYTSKKPLIIFCTAKKDNPIKNVSLAIESVELLKQSVDVDFRILSSLSHDELLLYYNSADVLLLTSFSEGSPNVIKEAMACNLPIVATNVGDIKERIKNDRYSYLTKFCSKDISKCLEKVITKKKRSKGRDILMNEKIDNNSIAERLIEFYNKE